MTFMAFDSRVCYLQPFCVPLNPLKFIGRHHVPARRCASVLGSSKLRRVNLSYGFPARLLVFLVNLQSKRLKSTLISRLEGGESDLCLHHLLLIIGPGKSNQEVDFLDKTGELHTVLIFENQNRAEGFIWQEIGSKIRKVCEILV